VKDLICGIRLRSRLIIGRDAILQPVLFGGARVLPEMELFS